MEAHEDFAIQYW